MKSYTSLLTFALATCGSTFSGHADAVTDWNTTALEAIRAAKSPPPVASRALAILHAAIYDAVNGIGRRYEPYLVPSAVPASASAEAAATVAAHDILITLFPGAAPQFDSLESAALAAIPQSPQKARGAEWGRAVAGEVWAARANDGAASLVLPPAGEGPGFWTPTPFGFAPYLLAQWAFLKNFVMTGPSQFRPPGPPGLESAQWAAEYNEVKAIGSATSSVRTPEQTQIALFWADGAGTATPPGHWNSIAQDVAAARANSIEENARLFALINLAMADAAVAAWDAKYTFNFWRPVTAIRNGALDGNPATDPDPAWNSLLVNPPFPDYVSGHSTFSGAAATVLARFYGTDDVSFTTGSDFLPGIERSFPSFSAAAAEAAVSRLYGGIHFPSAIQDGLVAGVSIGEWTSTHYLLPKPNRSRQ